MGMRWSALVIALASAACGNSVDAGDDAPHADADAENDQPAGDSPASNGSGDGAAALDDLAIVPAETVIAVVGEPLSASATVGTHTPPLIYAWTSSLDGDLGGGATLTTSDLTEGDHDLAVRVTDATGATATAHRAVHVLPRRFDWSHKLLPDAPPAAGDWMTSVKNQSTCGSCWSHAALAAMEARWNIQNGNPDLDLDLSEQWLIDCHHNGAVGCGGGAPEQALDFIATAGVPAETCDPFLAHNDTCSDTCDDGGAPALYRISARRAFYGSKAEVQAWTRDVVVHTGPVPRPMGGVYYWNPSTFACDNLAGDHYVVIVGYDHDAGVWLAKNSWGPAWNGNGYLKIAYGTCGMDASSTALGDVSAP